MQAFCLERTTSFPLHLMSREGKREVGDITDKMSLQSMPYAPTELLHISTATPRPPSNPCAEMASLIAARNIQRNQLAAFALGRGGLDTLSAAICSSCSGDNVFAAWYYGQKCGSAAGYD